MFSLMAKEDCNHLLCYVMIVLYVAGKVQSEPIPAGTAPIPERTDGSEESREDYVATAVTDDAILLVDSTTESTGTTHDRGLFTDTPVMDAITLIWYLATFIALISFFLVMACADRNRCRNNKPSAEQLTAPPTPAPSYRQFAPPSYDTLVFEKDNDSIFIIPYDTRIESDNQRNAEDLANSLEYIIRSPSLRRPSCHTVNRSDITVVNDETTVAASVPSVPVETSSSIERDVTVL
uniref:Uncharacterized protein n=1 Tax=Anopheles farauti TaxID=69004 RepID=A0A182QCC6_9DIPT